MLQTWNLCDCWRKFFLKPCKLGAALRSLIRFTYFAKFSKEMKTFNQGFFNCDYCFSSNPRLDSSPKPSKNMIPSTVDRFFCIRFSYLKNFNVRIDFNLLAMFRRLCRWCKKCWKRTESTVKREFFTTCSLG